MSRPRTDLGVEVVVTAEYQPTEDRREDHLYICLDAKGRALYVGRTDNVHRRLRVHRSKSSWWVHVVRVEVERYRGIAEVFTIRQRRPLYNRQHNRPAPIDAALAVRRWRWSRRDVVAYGEGRWDRGAA